MKKILAFFLLISLPVRAEFEFANGRDSLSISGYMIGYGMYDSDRQPQMAQFDVFGYGKLNFDARREVSDAFAAGFFLNFITQPYYGDRTKIYDEAYLYAEGEFGRLEIGRARNISRKMHVLTTDVGLLEVDGSFIFDHVYFPTGFRSINTTTINTDRTANKISYVSPQFGGVQLAGSLIPGADDLWGDSSMRYSKFKDAFTATVKYTLPDVFVMDVATARFNEIDNGLVLADAQEEYSAGARFYMRGWQLSGSYRLIRDIGADGPNRSSGEAFDYGIAYEFGPVKASIATFKSIADNTVSNTDKDTMNMTLFSTRFAIDKGVSASSTVGRVAYSTEQGEEGVGGIFTLGMEVEF
ncbi:MAG: porin [Rickettsiales bacterium]|jgi:predicted porin|nr:porin [Rickettsiales bacterium]